MYEVIYTQNEKEIIVDKSDAAILKNYKWYTGRDGYAVTQIYIGQRRNAISMQRFILNPPRDSQIDHINHNVLDNRRCNLRIVSRSENCMNQKLKSNNKSGYKGVILHKASSKWTAYITVNKKRKHLGIYKTKEEAIERRKQAELEYFKDFNYKELY